VEYTVPDSTVLAPLLTQLEALQALWAQVDRSALTSVTIWNTCTSLQHKSLLCFARSSDQRKMCIALGLMGDQIHAGQEICGHTTSCEA